MNFISIKEVLSSPESNDEWLCLPSDKNCWSLETKGAFTLDARDFAPDSDDYLPEQVRKGEWIEVLDGGTIEEIVSNAKMQLESPSLSDLFKAFIFYCENDSFIIFKE